MGARRGWCVPLNRHRPLDVAKEPAKLPVSDHLQGARSSYRASARREEVQLQQRGPRPEMDSTVGVQMAGVVAGYPVPAEDQVITDIHVHRGHRNRLATQAQKDMHGCRETQRSPGGRRRYRRRPWLTRGAEIERRS